MAQQVGLHPVHPAFCLQHTAAVKHVCHNALRVVEGFGGGRQQYQWIASVCV